MNKVLVNIKKLLVFIYKTFPFIGGYSIKDADELMKDPDNFNYRGNSFAKKLDDKEFNNRKDKWKLYIN